MTYVSSGEIKDGKDQKNSNYCMPALYPAQPDHQHSPYDGASVDQCSSDSCETEDEAKNRLVANTGHKPWKISEKRRADEEALHSFVRARQEEGIKKAEREDTRTNNSSGGYYKIATARGYQLELFEKCKEKNCIVVLGTGTGKTYIAALLLQHILDQELQMRQEGKNPRIAFFLVDKVALVKQQHDMLSCELDHLVGQLHGDMISASPDEEFWNDHFERYRVTVCTAQILLHCLREGYIRMCDINLLVFDEAHHTKKNHPYACIVKEFYVAEKNVEIRPRIMGTTASPVDTVGDTNDAALQLEQLLNSEIVTASTDEVAPKGEDRLVIYTRPQANPCTALSRELGYLIGHNQSIQEIMTVVQEAASELGPWCADRVWQWYFSGDEVDKQASKEECKLTEGLDFISETKRRHVDGEVDLIYKAGALVAQRVMQSPGVSQAHISSKVQKLLELLRLHFSHESDSICIIFVKKRYKAVVLVDLLSHQNIRPKYLRPAFLLGTGPGSKLAAANMSHREMKATINKFRYGDFNCLVSTNVAEEGLDLPGCNFVVRFDLCNTVIQYIQSRGRARSENARYYHMVEAGNLAHQQCVKRMKRQELELRKFCNELPRCRRVEILEPDWDEIVNGESGKTYRSPATGAVLNYKSATECLAAFAASLPGMQHSPPEYTVSAVGDQFVAEVLLPEQSPIRKGLGETSRRKAWARCSAAFKMCVELAEQGYLDDRLRSVFGKKLPKMRNAQLALSETKKAKYKMRVKPELWSQVGDQASRPSVLFLTVITFSKPEALSKKSRPLAILTRKPLPALPPIQLYLGIDKSTAACLSSTSPELELSDAELELLRAFTLRIFRDIFSKEYEASVGEFPYFFAPLSASHNVSISKETKPFGLVDWTLMSFVRENRSLDWKDQPESFFRNKYVMDSNSGSRKFYLCKVRKDMKPTDMVPSWVVPPQSRSWKATDAVRDIRLYSNSLWPKALAKYVYLTDQPVAEAELIPLRRNLLDEHVADEDMAPKTCFIILQPLLISSVSSRWRKEKCSIMSSPVPDPEYIASC